MRSFPMTKCPLCKKPLEMGQRVTTWSTGEVSHTACGDPTSPKDIARARRVTEDEGGES